MTGYPETEAVFLKAVSLPIYPSLHDEEIKAILQHAQPFLMR
jgi:dTDP-4-amino-4,6-dideoxygalactose transaminase